MLNLLKWWKGLKLSKSLSIVVILYFSTVTNLKSPNLNNLKLENTHDLNFPFSFNQAHIPIMSWTSLFEYSKGSTHLTGTTEFYLSTLPSYRFISFTVFLVSVSVITVCWVSQARSLDDFASHTQSVSKCFRISFWTWPLPWNPTVTVLE